jgi:hypothetical protein
MKAFFSWLVNLFYAYIWGRVKETFFFSILAWMLTLIMGHTVWLSQFVYIPDWNPPQVLSIIDQVFTILGIPALISTIMTGFGLLGKAIRSAITGQPI